ncbi:bifunctional metallophosphatase/5'-nucleotidase [Planotetraspora phitsanulokensis]|uniref:bifunctional metallophosphatase/5'-nucleotidase n=1 Tax=Planotetraspora phitsanulokensis TaxID=575192 RepID=UPI001950FAF2|nr:bifunctional metallophosphatase/5'-nucleotidase [Planotetraspora phitsanulokensis]
MTPASLTRLALVGVAAVSLTALAVAPAGATSSHHPSHHQPKPKTVPVRLLSINDFHGNLEAPTGSSGRIADENGVFVQGTGGAATLATAIKKSWAAGQTQVVAAGDLIGASPLLSAAYHDEPTVQTLGEMGLDVSSVGNHEYDEGMAELLRIQNGGCNPTDGCSPAGKWKGAEFQYLAANVVDKNGKHPLPPVAIRVVNGVKIGYIGLVTKNTPNIVTPAGVAGLTFQDEVEAGNRASQWLTRQGVKAQVVLVHEGDSVSSGASPDACPLTTTVGKTIATNLDAAVDVVIMGHSHQAYVCTTTDPKGQTRYFTQGSSFGRVLTQIDFKVDLKTKDVDRSSVKADNKVVAATSAFITNAAGSVNSGPYTGATYAADTKINNLVNYWKDAVSEKADAPIGKITGDISNTSASASPAGELPLGNLIADAQLAAAKSDGGNADIALMNPGGIRTSLTYAQSGSEGDGVVTYGEAFAVQPFNNLLQAVTLTGAQLKTVLEQQFYTGSLVARSPLILQPSSNLTYTYSASAPLGGKVSNIAINGVPVTDTQSVRVAANNFLVGGGDTFPAFTLGTDLWTWSGGFDVDAFTKYLGANSPVSPPALTHITKVS